MRQLDVASMIEYRAFLHYAPLTALKKFERLRSFFRFCEGAGWSGRDRRMTRIEGCPRE
jgi:hypothetical protein